MSSNMTQLDKQNAEIEDIAEYKKMKEMQISGWRQEAIDKKYALIKMARASGMRVKTTEKSLNNIITIRQKEKTDLQVAEEIVADGNRKSDETHRTVLKMEELSDNLAGRINTMQTIIEHHYQPKADHSLKIINSLNRKIDDLGKVYSGIDERHELTVAEKERELESCQNEILNSAQKELEIHQKFEDVSTETVLENEKIAKLNTVNEECQNLAKNIDSNMAASAQLTSEIEVQLEALQNLQQINESVLQKLEEISGNTEQANVQLDAVNFENEFKLTRFNDIEFLISLLNGQIDYEELEHDEVFRREIAASDFYIECKEDYIQLSRDNGDINADLEQVIENEEKNFEMLQNTRKDVEALEADVASLLAERNDLDRDRKDLQIDIQARQLKAQAAEKSLSNEITALTAELDRETTELEIEEKSFLETIAKLNLKLKHEQSKTRRAKQQQQSAKAEMELHRSSSQPLSLLEPSKMPFSQQEKAPLLKRRYQDREINAPIKPESPIKRRSLTKLSPISTLDPRSSSNKEAPMVKVPANRFSTTKENQYPVYLNDQDDEAAKRHEQAEEEKAFDSDETSMNITFNTDIDDLLTS